MSKGSLVFWAVMRCIQAKPSTVLSGRELCRYTGRFRVGVTLVTLPFLNPGKRPLDIQVVFPWTESTPDVMLLWFLSVSVKSLGFTKGCLLSFCRSADILIFLILLSLLSPHFYCLLSPLSFSLILSCLLIPQTFAVVTC